MVQEEDGRPQVLPGSGRQSACRLCCVLHPRTRADHAALSGARPPLPWAPAWVFGARWGQWGVGLPGAGAEHSFCRAGRCLTWVCVCTRPCAMTAQKQAGFLLLFNSIRMPPPPGSLPRPPPTLSSALSHSTWSREWALSVPRAAWVCRGRCPGKLARCWRPSKPPVKRRACTFHR